MKVLHLPSNTAGNAFGLAQGERALGLDAKALALGESCYRFPSDITINVSRKLLPQLWHRMKLFLALRQNYDVYHFNFGSSLVHYLNLGVNLWDLPYYTKEAVKVVTYQGCDARQKYPTMQRVKQQPDSHAACFYAGCYNGICNSGKRDSMRRKAIEKMMTHCQHAFALNPDLLHFLPQEKASFLPYTVPNFEMITPKVNAFFSNDKITIVHAPTQRVTKGTDFILAAIAKLEERFPNKINFRLIEKLPYNEALDVYRTADLVIDQVLIGWYGGLAVEVMKMGVPVAAYINEADLHFVPHDFVQELPIIRISPFTIVDDLTQLVLDRLQLVEWGKRAQDFVNKWHDPRYVASLTHKVYQQCAAF